MYCRSSLFPFSTAPFYHVQYESVKMQTHEASSLFMFGELAALSVVTDFKASPIRQQQPPYDFSQRLGLLLVPKLFHEQEVRASLCMPGWRCCPCPRRGPSPNRRSAFHWFPPDVRGCSSSCGCS